MAAKDNHVEGVDFEGSTLKSSDFLSDLHAQGVQLDPDYGDYLKSKGLILHAAESVKEFTLNDPVLDIPVEGFSSTLPAGDETFCNKYSVPFSEMNFSLLVLILSLIILAYDVRVRAKAKGKGKLYRITEKVEMLKKRARVDAPSSDASISSEGTDFLINSPSVVPACSNHSPETIRKRRALRSLSLYLSEKEFCEGSSDRSDSITKALARFAADGALDIDYNLLVKKSVFASFQALHFSSAAARAHQHQNSPENILKEKLSEQELLTLRIGEALDHEKALHVSTLNKLHEAEMKLEAARDSLRSLETKIDHTAARVAIHKEDFNDVAIQYTMMARIGLLLESVENRVSWYVHDEINAFKLWFSKVDLKEWGISCSSGDSSGEE